MRSHESLGGINAFTALTMLLVVATYAIKAVTDAVYVAQELDSVWVSSKYITALLACLTAIIATRGREVRFISEFSWLLLVFATFTLISLAESLVTGVFSSTVFSELFKLGMPMVFAYFALNALSFEQTTTCMKWILAVSLIGYGLQVSLAGVQLSDAISLIDFGSSYSPLESSYSAGTAIMLCLFFCYYRKSKVCMLVSVLFCLAVFKRLAFVFALAALVLPLLIDMKKRVTPRVVFLLTGLFTVGTALYAWLLLPAQNWLFVKYLGQSQAQFTMGRSTTMNYLLNGDFVSYGFGSANEVIESVFGMPFEMDLIKVAVELTPIAMVLLIFAFLKISSGNRWCVFMALYLLLNMLTSDSLTSNFSLALFYMGIGCIGAEQEDGDVGNPAAGGGTRVRPRGLARHDLR